MRNISGFALCQFFVGNADIDGSVWNVNVDGREDFDLSDSTFLYILKSYDEVLILDDHYSFNTMTKKLFGKTYKPGFHKTADLLANLKE